MSRTVPSNALAQLNTTHGTEPICVLEVQYTDTTFIRYCDKTKISSGNDSLEGKILSISNLDEVINISGNSISANISVELDDTDGSIKAILDTHDIHKRPARLYQYFGDLSNINDAILIFSGKIVSPIVWSSYNLTVKFDVISEIVSKEAGFSPEEGQFPGIPDNLTNKPWPLAFGECVHIPCTKAFSEITGTSLSLFGVPDATLPLKRQLIQIRIADLQSAYETYLQTIQVAENSMGQGVPVPYKAEPVATIVNDPDLAAKQAAQDKADAENQASVNDAQKAVIESAQVTINNYQEELARFEALIEKNEQGITDIDEAIVEYDKLIEQVKAGTSFAGGERVYTVFSDTGDYSRLGAQDDLLSDELTQQLLELSEDRVELAEDIETLKVKNTALRLEAAYIQERVAVNRTNIQQARTNLQFPTYVSYTDQKDLEAQIVASTKAIDAKRTEVYHKQAEFNANPDNELVEADLIQLQGELSNLIQLRINQRQALDILINPKDTGVTASAIKLQRDLINELERQYNIRRNQLTEKNLDLSTETNILNSLLEVDVADRDDAWAIAFADRKTRYTAIAAEITTLRNEIDVLKKQITIAKETFKSLTANDTYSGAPYLQEKYVNLISAEDELKQSIEDLQDSLKEQNRRLDSIIKKYNGLVAINSIDEAKTLVSTITDVRKMRDTVKQNLLKSIADYKEIGRDKEEIHRIQKVAEYLWDMVTKLRIKLEQILVEILQAKVNLDEVDRALNNQQQLCVPAMIVQGGDRFDQQSPTIVEVNQLLIAGQFTGNIFNISSILPTHSGVAIAPRQNNSIRHFWIQDPTITLKGLYILTDNGYIAKVTEQDGAMCKIEVVRRVGREEQESSTVYPTDEQVEEKIKADKGVLYNQLGSVELAELRETTRKEMLRKSLEDFLPDLLDSGETDESLLRIANELPVSYSKEILAKLAACNEYTINEIITAFETKLSDAGLRELSQELTEKRENLINSRRLKIDAQQWTDQDQAAYEKAYSENIASYQSYLKQVPSAKDLFDKIFRDISQKEQDFLERMTLFGYLLWKRANTPLKLEIPDEDSHDPAYYYFTAYDITYIREAAPIIIPRWLFGANLGTNKQVADRVNSLPESEAFVADVGTEIKLYGANQEVYIANILPSTVHAVYAYRGVGGVKRFVPVPSTYYTKYESYATTFQPMICTVIVLKKPLRSYREEQWDDDIYVTLTSSVGPNTADIIKYLAERYTNLSVDSTSYNAVKTSLTNYPSNFCLFEKLDTLGLIKDIAWQARCTAWVKNGILYLRYLSVEPDSVLTLTEDDVDAEGAISVTYSESDDLITKLTASWQPTYQYSDKKFKVILRSNINKYGELAEEFDFFIYNIRSLVEKSATFWLIRRSNTWKKVNFRTFLKNLGAETLDCVTLNFATSFFANGPVKCLVEKADYDSESQSVILDVWTPVRSGEMVAYDFAWPGSISVQTIYPKIEDIVSGNAGSVNNALVPTNAQYKYSDSGLDEDLLRLRPKDFGSFKPSDDYDDLPQSPISDLKELNYQLTPIENIPVKPAPKLEANGGQKGAVPIGGQFSVDAEVEETDTSIKGDFLEPGFVGFGKVIGRIIGAEESAQYEANLETVTTEFEEGTTVDENGDTQHEISEEERDTKLQELNDKVIKNQEYEVELSNGKVVRVRQLQIDDFEEVPIGTTTTVIYDTMLKRLCMQVPVWLDEQLNLNPEADRRIKPRGEALQVIQKAKPVAFPARIMSHEDTGAAASDSSAFGMVEYTMRLMVPQGKPTDEVDPDGIHPAGLNLGTLEFKAYSGYTSDEVLGTGKMAWCVTYQGFNYIIGTTC